MEMEEKMEEMEEEKMKMKMEEKMEENGTPRDPGHPTTHVLAHKLTRYERIQVIGMRAEQLARGAQAFVDAAGTVGPYELAEKELDSERLPMIVVRNMPDGKPQYLRLSGGGGGPAPARAT